MKENLSSSEIKYIKRRVANRIKEIIKEFSTVVVSGARQVGKSTMLINEFKGFAYYTMDDFDTVETLQKDPLFIFSQHEKIVIDEAQKLPEIFNTVKLVIDRDKNKRIILSGSSNIMLMKGITESLAGRAFYLEMSPMSYGEFCGIVKPKNFFNLWKKEVPFDIPKREISLLSLLIRGFMPKNMISGKTDNITLWFDSYVKTYLERDLRQLSQIESLIDFRRLMQSLALRTGNILNQADISRDIGISAPTTYRYIKLLEVSNIVERVYGFYNNKGKRIIKSPKIYYIDPGLSVFLSGYFDDESLSKAKELGGFFETVAFLHLKILCNMMNPPAKMYYWRDLRGREVDFIIEHGRKLLAVEVKMSKDVSIKDAKNLLYFLDMYPETVLGILLYTGNEIKWITSKIVAIPWWLIDW